VQKGQTEQNVPKKKLNAYGLRHSQPVADDIHAILQAEKLIKQNLADIFSRQIVYDRMKD